MKTKGYRYWLKHLLNALVLGTAISLIIAAVSYFADPSQWDWRKLLEHYQYNMIVSLMLYFANLMAWQWVQQRFGDQGFASRRLAIGVLVNIVVSLLAIFVANLIITVGIRGYSFSGFIQAQYLGFYVIALLISLVVVCGFYLAAYYKRWQETRVREQKIIAGTATARFDALKNQLDPHFLFNSLNVLTSLIEEDPDQAQQFTTALSKVYRYVLEQKDKELVPVDEELRFAKLYVALLAMRFEESVHFDIPEKSQDETAKIVPLSLQLLLENAIKHNIATLSKPLHIVVREENGHLVVSNNLQEKQTLKGGSGVGLQNIMQRYALLTDRKVTVNKTTTEFWVSVPVLTKRISTMETQESYLEEKRYKKAKERVEAIKGFYANVLAYCLVIPFLAYLNYKTTSFPWIIFPVLGWGFGVLMHGMEAYGYNPILGKGWEERKIREFMNKDNF